MKILKFFIPGNQFDEAYIYMGHLIIINIDRSIIFYELEKLAENIDSNLGGELPTASYFFARQDWLTQKPFKKLLTDEGIRDAFMKNTDRLLEQLIHTQDHSHFLPNAIQFDLPIKSKDILDLHCYGKRIYLGTTDGFYHIDIDWGKMEFEIFKKRLDYSCVSLSAAYGVVNASCAEEGLHSAYYELFGYDNKHDNKLNKIADKSIKTGWMDSDLVNYETLNTSHFYKSKTDRVESSSGESKKKVVTEFSKHSINLNEIGMKEIQESGFSSEEIQFEFNSRNQIVFHTFNDNYYTWYNPIKTTKESSKWRTFKGSGGRILEASYSKDGLVVETDESVMLLSEDKWYNLVNEPAISVRTYLSSKRCQNLITVVTEKGIWLIAAWDPNALYRS